MVSFLTFIFKLLIVNKIHLLLLFTVVLVLTPGGSVVKNPPEMQKTWIRSLGWEIPREGNGNPLQYSCLETSTDRGAWQTTVHGGTKSWTVLRD